MLLEVVHIIYKQLQLSFAKPTVTDTDDNNNNKDPSSNSRPETPTDKSDNEDIEIIDITKSAKEEAVKKIRQWWKIFYAGNNTHNYFRRELEEAEVAYIRLFPCRA
jgi:hypothetical protein